MMSEEIRAASADLREIARLRTALASAQRLADDWEAVANRQRAELESCNLATVRLMSERDAARRETADLRAALDVALKECEQWRARWADDKPWLNPA